MQIRVEQVLFRSLLARRFGLSPGGYLVLLLARLAERRESERRPRGWAMLLARGSRAPMEGSKRPDPPSRSAREIKRVTFFREGGDRVEVRARRRYPRRRHGLQHATDQIEFFGTTALEQDRRSRDLGTTVKFHLANANLCNLAIASGLEILLHVTNLDMRCIDTSCELNAAIIYDYRMARMYEYRHVGSVDVSASQSNLHVDILAHQTQPDHFASVILGLCLLCVGFSK